MEVAVQYAVLAPGIREPSAATVTPRDPHPLRNKGPTRGGDRQHFCYFSLFRRSSSAGLGSLSWKSPVFTAPARW